MCSSPTSGAGGLQGFLVPSFVESLHVVVASQEAVSGLQSTTQQVQKVIGKMAPPVVNVTHYNVSGPFGTSRGERWNKWDEVKSFMLKQNKVDDSVYAEPIFIFPFLFTN